MSFKSHVNCKRFISSFFLRIFSAFVSSLYIECGFKKKKDVPEHKKSIKYRMDKQTNTDTYGHDIQCVCKERKQIHSKCKQRRKKNMTINDDHEIYIKTNQSVWPTYFK